MQALLSTMQPQYKFALMARITQDILSSAADGGLPLDRCAHVVADAMDLLGIPEMQIDVKKGLPPAEEEILDDGGAQVRAQNPTAACCLIFICKNGLAGTKCLQTHYEPSTCHVFADVRNVRLGGLQRPCLKASSATSPSHSPSLLTEYCILEYWIQAEPILEWIGE
jgi:hypothetical protein